MTRLIRVDLCDECPHAVGSRSCRATNRQEVREVWAGRLDICKVVSA